MALRFRILAADRRSPPNEPAPAEDRVVDVADDLSEIRLGRRVGLEVALPFPALSSLHARLVRHGDGWALEDLGSTNGTALEDHRLTAHQPRPLRPGQTFRLAHVAVVFEGVVAADRSAEGTGTIARRLVSDLFAGRDDAEAPQMIVLNGAASGRVLRLARPDRPYTVGRSPTCDLSVDIDEISREHAGFSRGWEGVFVHDLGSKNGISVAGARVIGTRRLRDGDCVDVGPITLRLDDAEDRYLRAMEESEGHPPPAAVPPEPVAATPPAPPPPAADTIARPPRRGATLPMAIAVVVLLGLAVVVVSLLLG